MLWRAFIVIFCAAFITLSVLENFVLTPRLFAGFRAPSVTTEPFVLRITEVYPGGLAQQLGIRPGDRIDLRDAAPRDRWWGYTGAVVGHRYHLTIERGVGRRVIVLEPQKPISWTAKIPLNVYVGAAGFVWFLLFAAFIGVRCAGDRRARLLSLCIALIPASSILAPNNLVTPWPAIGVAAATVANLFGGLSFAALIIYALQFAVPISRLRRIISSVALTAIAVDTLLGILSVLGYWFGVFDITTPTGLAIVGICDGTQASVVVTACAVALYAAAGDERSRLAWSTIPLLCMFSVNIVTEIVGILAPGFSTAMIGLAINNTALFVAPLGLTYALLGRRILDIGFALNRAAVFAATSLILAGVFAGLQWSVSTLLAGVLPVRGFVSQIAIIVAVYYVVRLSRRTTDAFITRVFFAARDRRLRALREAIHAIDEVQDAAALAPFVVDYLSTRARISARVFYQDADGAYVPVAGCSPGTLPLGRDSTGVVALRAKREPLSLPDFQQLGGVACPMLVRGRLRGVMLCDAPDDGELAPDEVHALATIANRIAGDRDDLLAEELRHEVETLRVENRTLRFGSMSPQP